MSKNDGYRSVKCYLLGVWGSIGSGVCCKIILQLKTVEIFT